MRFLALDPSVNNVGWTLFDSKKPAMKMWRWGTFNLEGFNRTQRICDLRGMIDLTIKGGFDHLVGEYPTFFSSEKGQIAAHKSYTIDLAYVLGYIAGWYQKDHRTFHPITAIEWKGAVKKEVTARKFFRIFKVPLYTLSEHAIDSTMMLRHFLLTGEAIRLFRAAGEDYPATPTLSF